jgi:glycerol kinase
MEQDSGIALDVLRVDGGMVDNALLMQFQADILNRPVVKPLNKETTSLGAAYAAGVAVGFYDSTDDLRARWTAGQTWNPSLDEAKRAEMYRMWKKAVTRSFDWTE